MSREFYVPCQPYAYPDEQPSVYRRYADRYKVSSSLSSAENARLFASSESVAMSVEASASTETERSSAVSPIGPSSATFDGTSRISALSNFRNRIRSRLSSSIVGVRFKQLVKWRRANKTMVESSKGLVVNASSSQTCLDVPVNIADDPSKCTPGNSTKMAYLSHLCEQHLCELPEKMGTRSSVSQARKALAKRQWRYDFSEVPEIINLNNAINESCIESQENKIDIPDNHIESNFVANSFDPGTSSFSTIDYIPSYTTAHDTEVSATNSIETTNELPDEIVNDELNPINGDESLSIPSAVIGVQINTGSLAARILDVVPILYIENSSLNSSSNTRSTRTEESFASGSEDSAGSTSSGAIEIVSTRDESRRRFEDDYVRPYYDLSVRPIIRKQFHQLDDDPPIY